MTGFSKTFSSFVSGSGANSFVQFDARAKAFFVDTRKWDDKIDKTVERSLVRGGGLVRKIAIRSLRRRKKSANPGNPPSVHSRDPVATLKAIWSIVNFQSLNALVGPRKLRGNKLANRGMRGQTVPQLLNFGGSVDIPEVFMPWTRQQPRKKKDGTPDRRFKIVGRNDGWVRDSYRRRRKFPELKRRWRRANYAAFPFMKPALDEAVSTNIWEKSFVGILEGVQNAPIPFGLAP